MTRAVISAMVALLLWLACEVLTAMQANQYNLIIFTVGLIFAVRAVYLYARRDALGG